MKTILKRTSLGVATLATIGVMASVSTGVFAQDNTSSTMFRANLSQLNNSGASGTLSVQMNGSKATVTEHVTGLLAGSPHAQHLHFDAAASHTCPDPSADKNNDKIISSIEARPAYGTPTISLTTTGDTSAKSALALKSFPTAPNGTVDYNRTITLTTDQMQELKDGQLVAVVHGIDVNGNGKYDTDAGKSPLAKAALGNDNFPLEGTAPAACGVVTASTSDNTDGTTSSNNQTNDSDNSNSAMTVAYWALGLGIVGVVLSLISMAVASTRRR